MEQPHHHDVTDLVGVAPDSDAENQDEHGHGAWMTFGHGSGTEDHHHHQEGGAAAHHQGVAPPLPPAATATSSGGSAEIDSNTGIDTSSLAFVFSQDPHHEDATAVVDDDSATEAKRAEITKTFFQAFFDYPAIANAQDYQVLVDEIDFLYDSAVPVRLRQRKQERAKYRLNELREALQRSSDEAAGILPPPPPSAAEHHQHQHHQHQLHHHAGVGGVVGHHDAPPLSTPEKSRKRRKIEFDKKAWSKRERAKSYWLGMRGPFFAAQADAFHKLEKLIGHSFPHLNDQSFRASWEREVARRQQATTFLLSNPKGTAAAGAIKPPGSAGATQQQSSSAAHTSVAPAAFPVYDMWRDADQPTNPNAPHYFVHFVFDVPGVTEEPKFTFSKATRKWQLEGTHTHTHALAWSRCLSRHACMYVLLTWSVCSQGRDQARA
jgi:hypothetical protein